MIMAQYKELIRVQDDELAILRVKVQGHDERVAELEKLRQQVKSSFIHFHLDIFIKVFSRAYHEVCSLIGRKFVKLHGHNVTATANREFNYFLIQIIANSRQICVAGIGSLLLAMESWEINPER